VPVCISVNARIVPFLKKIVALSGDKKTKAWGEASPNPLKVPNHSNNQIFKVYDNYGLALLRLATPTKPNRPLPNNHTAAGTGTAGVADPTSPD